MDRHGHLTKNQTEAKKAEVDFTKMILLLGAICMVSRLFNSSTKNIFEFLKNLNGLFKYLFFSKCPCLFENEQELVEACIKICRTQKGNLILQF